MRDLTSKTGGGQQEQLAIDLHLKMKKGMLRRRDVLRLAFRARSRRA